MTARGRMASAGWWLAIGLVALWPDRCPGASPYQPSFGEPLLESWRWRVFAELTGLDGHCMAEGADGTMWFGTANGLRSWDGITWMDHSTNESLGRIVTSLCSAPDGSLYAAHGAGISQFRDGHWTRLLSTPGGRIVNVVDVPINRLAVGLDGSLWAATSWGALHRRQSTWTLYTDPDTASRLKEDRSLPFVTIKLLPEAVTARFRGGSASSSRCDFTEVCAHGPGRIWFGTTGGEVLSYTPAAVPAGAMSEGSDGIWEVYDESDGLAPGVITSILPQADGTLWVVPAASDRANVFDGRAWRTIGLPLYLPALDLADVGGRLLQTRDGVLWLAARYQLFAYREGRWRAYDLPEAQSPSTRNVVMQSADGALWLVGTNTEIHRVDYQTPRWLTLYDLNFQWESPTGAQWFLHRDGRVVVHESDQWTSLGVEDGLMDTPVAVLGTRRGEVWVAGSHDHTAATARFDGRTWTRHLHPEFSFAVDWRAVFESSDGSVWFGAYVDTDGPEEHRNGILQYRDGVWTHHHQPGRAPHGVAEDPAALLPASTRLDHPIEKFICLGESRDGKIWAGRNILACYDGTRWGEVFLPAHMRTRNIETMLTTAERELWVGSRESGALRYDGKAWQHFQGKDSLVANSVRSLAQTADGSIWAATDRGASRFDGSTWMADVLPGELDFPHEGGGLKASASGHVWINRYSLYWMRRAWRKSPPPDPNAEFRTVRYQFHGPPPRTSITSGAQIISHPGNLAVLWSAVVPWRDGKDVRLQYSYRLDDQPWSDFTSDRGHSFFTLPSGRHRLEVRARDHDFNVDPTPATLGFEVLPPVWRQFWFILLMVLLCGLIIAQSIRVFLEQARLRKAHDLLEERVQQRTAELQLANRELEASNRELEAFSYSVSHDLRAPLRAIDGFSRVLMDDCSDKLGGEDKENLETVRAASQRMGRLIDDMLRLSRITRSDMRSEAVDLSRMAEQVAGDLRKADPARQVVFVLAPDCVVWGDAALLRIALENILGNAWKYTGKKPLAKIEFGTNGTTETEGPVYFVRDNGAGFDMAYAKKLFGAFQRLHSTAEFPGTGIGLAVVQRVIHRHGGRVWAEAAVDVGATFYFTLGKQSAT